MKKTPSRAKHAGIRVGVWNALVRSPRALPVLFASREMAEQNRDPDEYLVRVQVRTDPPTRVDVRLILRPSVARQLVRDFKSGESPRAIAKRSGLSYDGMCELLRTALR